MELTYKGILHSNLNGRLIAENLIMENRDFFVNPKVRFQNRSKPPHSC